jgi:hypothetical protein
MTATPETYTGKDAEVWIGLKDESGKTHTELAIGELSITLDRGTVDRPLLGETGNFHTQGVLSITGSLTAAKLSDGTAGIFLKSIIKGDSTHRIWISGQFGDKSLHFNFTEVMITSSGIEMGDASTISDGSFDFQIMNPVDIQKSNTASGGVKIEC